MAYPRARNVVKIKMGDNDKKSFWTSLPGILTGVAAVIVALGGIYAAATHNIMPPSNQAPSNQAPSNQAPSNQAPSNQAPSNQAQHRCGGELPGVTLFGSWEWTGANQGSEKSGIFTFKKDCTFIGIPETGYSGRDQGTFSVSDAPPEISITSNKQTKYFRISDITNNSFHAVNDESSLDFTRRQ